MKNRIKSFRNINMVEKTMGDGSCVYDVNIGEACVPCCNYAVADALFDNIMYLICAAENDIVTTVRVK